MKARATFVVGLALGIDAQHDAGDDTEGEADEGGGEGRLEMRPDTAAPEQVDERGADLARARRIERVEEAGPARRLPDRHEDGEGRELARPRVTRAHGRRSTSRDRSFQIFS